MEDKFYCRYAHKKCFSKRDAHETISWFKKTPGKHGKISGYIPKRSYYCEYCGMYHLTHLKNKR